MLFNSLEFLIFFPVVTTLYFLVPHKSRWSLLLLASCFFYMAFIPLYIFVLLITIIVDYIAGILIEDATSNKKKVYLIISILSTCFVLFIFKYFNFFNDSFRSFATFFHWNYPVEVLKIILPIGLSFHTFQSLSYVIEVYRGNQKAERHFGIYSLYVMFYPQLVAGPIERPQNLLHQFRENHYFDSQRVFDGLKLMAWGLFKKVVIADRAAMVVNHVYANPTAYDGLSLIIATISFSFQIYCDFSGYSDMAIGAAQVMGFKLMDNFNRPYFSKSISEFWQRWHISLSTWFKDYLYIPLGGNRLSKGRWQANLMLTFMISGLWHGANWTYILWGSLNGFYLVFSLWTKKFRKSFHSLLGSKRYPMMILKLMQVLITFSLISFAWIFFRAKSITDAFYIATHLTDGISNIRNRAYLKKTIDNIGLSNTELQIAIVAILFMEVFHFIQRHGSIRHMLKSRPIWLRWAIYYLLIIGILFFGVFGKNSFIYFQF